MAVWMALGGLFLANDQLLAPLNNKDEYLRLCGVIARLVANASKTPAGRGRPVMFVYALMAAFNSILRDPPEDATALIDDDLLKVTKSRTRVWLRNRMKTAPKWPGSEPQLTAALAQFCANGFLSLDSNKYSIRLKLLEWLTAHASSVFEALFKEKPPETWKNGARGSWLDLNQMFFKHIYEVIGESWRAFRIATNDEIGAYERKRKGHDKDYSKDYIGEKPEYWIVIFTVGFQQPINRHDIPARGNKLEINTYAKKPTDIAIAVEELSKYNIVCIDETGTVRIAPKFSPLMDAVIAAVELNLPKLFAECASWKAGQTK